MVIAHRLLLAGLFALAVAGAETPAAKAAVLDLGGRSLDPLAIGHGKPLVFVFVSVDCPISNGYSPELRRLRKEFEGVEFRLVYPTADQTASQVKDHLASYSLPFEAFRDPEQSLVKLAQVRVTPEAAVYLPGKGWIYRGRIDDRHVDFGKKRPAPTRHDLREVLRAVAEGREVTPITTLAVGCYIAGKD